MNELEQLRAKVKIARDALAKIECRTMSMYTTRLHMTDDMKEIARKALAALDSAEPVSQWQPIETAPNGETS